MSRGAPATSAEGADTYLTPTCAAYSTAPRSPTSPASCPTARPTPFRSGSAHGDHVAILTGPGSRKARNLRRDPRVALSLTPVDNPFQPVVIRGRVAKWLEGDPAWEIVGRISTKYTGGSYPRGEERVIALIEPERQTVGIG